MRVLIVAANASAKWGGEAILPLHIFRGLRAAGHEAWLCVGEETRAELEETLGPDARWVEYVPDAVMHSAFRWVDGHVPAWLGSHPTYIPQVILSQLMLRQRVAQLVRTLRIDIVHQPTPVSPKALTFLFDLPVPYVVGPMNGGMEYPPGFRFLDPSGKRLVRQAGRIAANAFHLVLDSKRRADLLLVANRRTRDALPAFTKGQVREMVENGVVPELWDRNEPVAAPASPASPGRPFQLIFMGRLVRWKGAEWLLDAVALALKSTPCHLTIVGDYRDERERLAARAANLQIAEHVDLLGWQSQARCADLLRSADALVLPSVFECGGAVVLEAMAAAKPVIAVDWGGPSDYLDERCGILVPPRDPEHVAAGIAGAIIELANDPQRCVRMGRAGHAKVLSEYAWPRKIERFVEFYRMAQEARLKTTRAAVRAAPRVP